MVTAMTIIDMQVDFFAHERLAMNRVRLAASTNRLVGAARQHGVPIIWIKTEYEPDLRDASIEIRKKGIHVVIRGTDGARLLPELDWREADAMLVKKRYSAFFGTTLDDLLQTHGCSRLIVAGVNTHACVRTTVVDAYQRDYAVILARDCIDSHDLEHHRVSWEYMDGKLGEALGVAEITTLLAEAPADGV